MVSAQVLGSDVDMNVILVQEVMGKLFNLLGPGSGPHENLSVRSDLFKNLPDLGFETHIQHSISFVQTQVGNSEQKLKYTKNK